MKKIALVVAGGSGSRLKSDIPKQFMELAGKPILMHSIEKFGGLADEIIVVLPRQSFSFWNSLCDKHQFTIKHQLVSGGSSRAESVKNGLEAMEGEGIVAVHDAVRPLVSKDLLKQLFKMALEKGNAIPVVPVKDSIRKMNGINSVSVDRSGLVAVQTPQCFRVNDLKSAFQQKDFHLFTDEASLAEAAGYSIYTMEGELRNVKITFPEDFLFAERILMLKN